MFTAAELAEHQADAESLMQDLFDVTYPTGGMATDADGYEIPEMAAVESTIGKIQSQVREGDVKTRYVDVQGTSRPIIEGGLHIPVGATTPKVGWVYTLTTPGPATPPELAGRQFRVEDKPVAKSWMTARRLNVVDVTPPEAP